MSKTKIVVLKLKELIYTAIFVCLGILLLILLLVMFLSGKKDNVTPTADVPAMYHAGIYTSMLTLNDTALSLEIVCDPNHINSVRLVNLDESITTMYPLLSPALEDLELQLSTGIALEELVLTESCKYTQSLLIDVIEQTLAKAVAE